MAGKVRVLVVVLAVVGMTAAAPAASRARDRCARHNTVTIRQTRLVRVYRGPSGVFACWRASGRRVSLWIEDEYDAGGLDAVAGAFVAYDSQSYPTCKADCPPGVNGTSDTEVVNVRTRRRRDLDQRASAVALARSGAVAWLVPNGAGGSDLWLWDRHGRRKLDSGDIPGRSLRLAHGTLRWTNAGQAKSAPAP